MSILWSTLTWGLCRTPSWLEGLLFAVFYPLWAATHRSETTRVANHLRLSRPVARVLWPTVRECYQSLFHNGLESLRILCRFPPALKCLQVEWPEQLEHLLRKGAPVAFASAHVGAFEALHRSLADIGRPVLVPVATIRPRSLDHTMNKLRFCPNVQTIPPESAPHSLRKVTQGEVTLALMIDQSPSGKGTIRPVLGRSFPLQIRLLEVANRQGAWVVPFHTWNDGDCNRIRFSPPIPPSQDPGQVADQMAQELESWILEHPEQFAWGHPRLWVT